MVRSNADRNVAMMANQAIIGDRSVGQFPSDAMRVRVLSSKPELPVAICADASAPEPATVCLFNIRPKPYRWVDGFCGINTRPRAVTTHMRDGFCHQDTAVFTGSCDRRTFHDHTSGEVARTRTPSAWFTRALKSDISAMFASTGNTRRVVLPETVMTGNEWRRHTSSIAVSGPIQ